MIICRHIERIAGYLEIGHFLEGKTLLKKTMEVKLKNLIFKIYESYHTILHACVLTLSKKTPAHLRKVYTHWRKNLAQSLSKKMCRHAPPANV